METVVILTKQGSRSLDVTEWIIIKVVSAPKTRNAHIIWHEMQYKETAVALRL